jgi:hypothetical protein
MSHHTGTDRAQTLLLPESLDDYVGREKSVHFIDAFVDGLDLMEAGAAPIGRHALGRRLLRAGDAVRPVDVTVRPGEIGQHAYFNDWRLGTRAPPRSTHHTGRHSANQRGPARDAHNTFLLS